MTKEEIQELYELQKQFTEKFKKPVPNNKKNDVEWLKDQLAKELPTEEATTINAIDTPRIDTFKAIILKKNLTYEGAIYLKGTPLPEHIKFDLKGLEQRGII